MLFLPLLGCASPRPARTGECCATGRAAVDATANQAAKSRNHGWCREGTRPIAANLALGSHPQQVRIAEALTYRSDWPAVRGGYVLEDVATFFSYSYDDQTFFDRFSGGYFSLLESTRQGVIAR